MKSKSVLAAGIGRFLEEHSAVLRDVYDNISDLLLLIRSGADGQYVCVSGNRAFYDCWGLEAGGVEGRRLEEVLPGAACGKLIRRIEEACASGKPVRFEQSDETPFGRKVHDATLIPTLNDAGVCTHLVWTACDITDRIRVTDLERANAERQRALLNSIPDFAWMKDREGRYSAMNQAMAKLAGKTAEEVIGKTDFELFPREKAVIYRESDQRVMRTGKAARMTVSLACADGKVTWFDTIKVPILDAQGGVEGTAGVARDITERQSLLRDLERSERRLREAERIAKIGNWEWDIEKGQFTRSDSIYEATGVTAEEIGASVEDFLAFVHPGDRARMKGLLERAAQEGVGWETEYRIVRGDGTVRYLHSTSEVTGVSRGCPAKVLGVTRDVTEQHYAEEEARRSKEELHRLSSQLLVLQEEERKKIAREIHDEFGQALTALKMDMAWMKSKLSQDQPGLRAKADKMANLMDSTIQAMRKTVMELRPTILDELGLIQAVRWQVEQFRGRSGLKVKLIIDRDDIAPSPETSGPLFRILQEALTNIVRHSGAKHVEVELRHSDSELEMRISDDGSGFCWQTVKKGHSHGLIGMRERAELIGGKLEVSSEKGRGTTVRVKVPNYRG